jgi:hypothetical protein
VEYTKTKKIPGVFHALFVVAYWDAVLPAKAGIVFLFFDFSRERTLAKSQDKNAEYLAPV